VEVEHSLSDMRLAESHAIGRNRRVGQLLCSLSLMRGHGLWPAHTSCSVTGASLEDYHASAGNEAAHYLPGQVWLQAPGKARKLPWDPVTHGGTRDAMGALFSREQNLGANFNKADSYAEKYARPSLKTLLAQVCNAVLDSSPAPAGRVDVAAVQGAYAHWIEQSRLSYRSAINRKIDIAELDDLPPATAPGVDADGRLEHALLNESLPELWQRSVRKNSSGGPGTTVFAYSEQTRILGHYLRACQDTVLGSRLIQDVQDSFRP
jgi:hypothetical protein